MGAEGRLADFPKARSYSSQIVRCNYSYYWKRTYFLVFVQSKYCEALIQAIPLPMRKLFQIPELYLS